ncbi:MAG: Anti-sigma-factor antagonist [Chthoniobacteraceae bacterium]|nr:Anti-sigma-factor antagonist [Chthoniobacteraceae bacterium]
MNFVEENGTILITITGRGRQEDIPLLASFAKEMMGKGHRTFAFELGECNGMDPELLGTVAGIALRLDELGSGAVRLLHLHEDMVSGIRELNLDRLFEFA